MRGLVILLLFISLEASAQNSRLGVTYTPTDLFLQSYTGMSDGTFETTGLIGFGINRTIFQQRLYPEVGIHVAYPIGNKFRCLPYAQFSFSILKVTQYTHHVWYNNELGVRLELDKWHGFGVSAGYRSLFEFWRQQNNQNSTLSFGLVAGAYIVL